MDDEFYLKIISSSKTLYEDSIERITIVGVNGEFTILKDFYNFIGVTREGEITIIKEGKEIKFLLKEGLVTFEKNKLIYIVN